MRFVVGLLVCTALIFQAKGQSPQGINYQGVARDAEGKPLASQSITIRISILKDGASGETEFAETHEVKTNSFGLFMLVIGQGEAKTGSFQFISWAVGTKWLQIEMDPAGGNSFQLMGSQQLMSVPYAFYSSYSGNGLTAGQGIKIQNNQINNTGDADNDPTNETLTNLTLGSDRKLKVTEGGKTTEVDLSSLASTGQNLGGVLNVGNNAAGSKIINLGAPTAAADAATKQYVDAHSDGDASTANEIQDLTKTGNTLSLSGDATTVDLSPYLDNTDNQELSLTGNTLNLTNSATTISLATYLDNTDSQSLSTSSSGTTRTVNISGGNSISIDVADDDNSKTNELQDISRSGNTLSLTGSATSVDLALYLDNTDDQTLTTLSVDANTRSVTITGGNTLNVDVRDADASVTNEIQNLGNTASGTQRTLTITGGTGTTIDVADNDNDANNELQNLNQVLTRGKDAGGLQIQNLGTPTIGTDATTKGYVDNAIATAIATNYAFKVPYAFSSSGTVVINQVVTLATPIYNDFNMAASNKITIPANGSGYYNFSVDGSSVGASVSLKLRVNSSTIYTIKRYSGIGMLYDIQTLMLKLDAGDFIELLIDSLTVGDQANGVLFGSKL